MMRRHTNCFLFMLVGGATGDASMMASSLRKIYLRPTVGLPAADTILVLENAMETVLLDVIKQSKNEDILLDANVVVHKIDRMNESRAEIQLPTSLVSFAVLGHFQRGSQPEGPNSLDSLIDETFSLTKLGFRNLLRSTNDVFLNRTAEATLVPLRMTMSAPDGPTTILSPAESRSLSGLDVGLLCASSAIFFGMLAMVFQGSKHRLLVSPPPFHPSPTMNDQGETFHPPVESEEASVAVDPDDMGSVQSDVSNVTPTHMAGGASSPARSVVSSTVSGLVRILASPQWSARSCQSDKFSDPFASPASAGRTVESFTDSSGSSSTGGRRPYSAASLLGSPGWSTISSLSSKFTDPFQSPGSRNPAAGGPALPLDLSPYSHVEGSLSKHFSSKASAGMSDTHVSSLSPNSDESLSTNFSYKWFNEIPSDSGDTQDAFGIGKEPAPPSKSTVAYLADWARKVSVVNRSDPAQEDSAQATTDTECSQIIADEKVQLDYKGSGSDFADIPL